MTLPSNPDREAEDAINPNSGARCDLNGHCTGRGHKFPLFKLR
jgi:hypothetical protein